MKLVTFEVATPLGPVERLGALRGGRIVDLNLAAEFLYKAEDRARPAERAAFFVPPDLLGLLDGGDEALGEARRALDALTGEPAGPNGERVVWGEGEVRLKAPLPRPRSLRDFFAFEDHAKAGAARRKEPLQKEWYDQPVFYKGNPREVYGPGDELVWPAFTRRLDFEFEIAAVVGRPGRDVAVENAARHIAGYTIMNDCSARDVQKNEMVCRMGPAKGKDFATVLGPWLVTADEWPGKIPELKVRVNGTEWSRSDGVQPYWGFPVMLSHASQGETLLPGDLLGSGTYHKGCGLDQDRWLKPGDVLELDAGPLGVLTNKVGAPRGAAHLKYNRDGSYAS
ncbi:MAG: fumarylacetoacetate hydrolase family protein [Elusimicrobia bacterium]|nr:fumarylacetoacetate hydrolase family protein [Elusimicrobiota bacterium]